jgi:hypothetical protein
MHFQRMLRNVCVLIYFWFVALNCKHCYHSLGEKFFFFLLIFHNGNYFWCACRELKLGELNEYLNLSAIFCPTGSSTGIVNASPEYIQRVRQFSQSHNQYIRIDMDGDMSVPTSSSYASPMDRSKQSMFV